MADQSTLDLKGRAADPVLEKVRQHPDRTLRFRFVEHPGYLKVEFLDADGEPTGGSTAVSYLLLKHSERWER